MIKRIFIALWSGTACILLGTVLTDHQAFLGSLIGYWVGFGYTLWSHRETLRSSELDIQTAIKRVRRSFIKRLGVVTLIVVAVARFQESWLPSLALGVAIGMIVSFIIVAIHQISGERGDKKSA
ncbi:MAG: ATP synthase I [Desulfosporosinus sp. BRH_c37]|nr:MAG: ATP synthase I [Desulfosporosinus sp. BRH_c37]